MYEHTKEEYEKMKAWGMLTSLDLHGCDMKKVESKETIEKWIIELCKLIDMKRYGEPHVVYFGDNPKVSGYSAFQLIETSGITGHFGLGPTGKDGYAYVDIFSCKHFDPFKAAEFTKKWFGAKEYRINTIYRKSSFQESGETEKGRAISVGIKKLLEDVETPYQHLQIFDTVYFGKMLVLDGAIMITDFDEFVYHEMISHVPLLTHPNPKRVLIIGGGDGGVAREVAKHPGVEEIHVCEIDETVVDLCKKHFPKVSTALGDRRVKIFYEDGSKFIKEHKGHYDVILVDSSDPVGPAEPLFKENFYKDLKDAAAADGIIVTQSESMYYHKELLKGMAEFNKRLFPVYKYYHANVPTYPSGVIGFSFCSKKHEPMKFDEKRAAQLKGLQYYTPEIHRAAFVLPKFFRELT
ncbi:polyamine aminopropyltransferase, partial [Candidatus Micrarchaeota archaeon]|nr:polyamine aminopropyltransferase [Candidatus Micrarchaeota archaeon]